MGRGWGEHFFFCCGGQDKAQTLLWVMQAASLLEGTFSGMGLNLWHILAYIYSFIVFPTYK